MIYGTNWRKIEFNGKCLVAFVDILGFSDEIKNTWKNSGEELFSRMKKFTNVVNGNISKQIKKVRSEAERDTYYGCSIKTFSDSIIVLYAFNGKPDKRRFLIGLYYLLYTASFVWKTALKLNFTVRGGIEYDYMRWDYQVLLGPALVNAYKLENKTALSSRIVLGRNVLSDICSAFLDENNKRDMRLKPIYNHLRDLIRPFLFVDCDGHLILSPHSLYKKKSEKEDIINIIKRMQNNCANLKTRLKYAPLLDALSNKKAGILDSDIDIIRNSYATSTT